jgi:methylglutamate dehydrogenase subunit D
VPRQLQPVSALPAGTSLRVAGLAIAAGDRATILQLDRPRVTIESPPPPGRCLRSGAMELLSIGPDRFLALRPDRPLDGAIDVSSAWTWLVVQGPNAANLLGKGCTLDLHPRVFAAGTCAVTGFDRMRIVLWRPDASSRYDLLVGRSCALSLWEWLTEAAAAFGVGVDEKAGAE